MMQQRGFTIIEVLLFLSISGMLFIIALLAMNATIQNTRFTDATNSLENFLSQQYSDVRSGVSQRIDDEKQCSNSYAAQPPGAADNCIVVGRMLALGSTGEFANASDTFTVYPILANRCPDDTQPTENGCQGFAGTVNCPAQDASSAGRIAKYCPRVLTNGYSQDYVMEWGIHMPEEAGAHANPAVNGVTGPSGFNRIAIIHSPTSERIYTYVYSGSGDLNDDLDPISPQFLTAATADNQVLMCLRSPEFLSGYHYVGMGGGQGSDLIQSGDAGSLQGAMTCG